MPVDLYTHFVDTSGDTIFSSFQFQTAFISDFNIKVLYTIHIIEYHYSHVNILFIYISIQYNTILLCGQYSMVYNFTNPNVFFFVFLFLQDMLLRAVRSSKIHQTGVQPTIKPHKWSYASAFLYSLTLITTIGKFIYTYV